MKSKMMWATFILFAIGGLLAAMACKQVQGFRYKVIVSVETPEGIKTGSAVREMTVIRPTVQIEGLKDIRVLSKGEAVAVDLGSRGVLFAVMGTDDYRMVFETIPTDKGGITPEGIAYYRELARKKFAKEMVPSNYPLLVTFKNLNEPETVTSVYRVYSKVEYSNNPDDLVIEDKSGDIFGEGVKIHSVVITMTEDPVTWGTEKWIPWIRGYSEEPILKKINPYDFSPEAQLRKGHFISGAKDE